MSQIGSRQSSLLRRKRRKNVEIYAKRGKVQRKIKDKGRDHKSIGRHFSGIVEMQILVIIEREEITLRDKRRNV